MIRVAVVDDHPIVRRGVVEVLSDADDMEIVGEEGTGHGAMTLLEATQPDVLVLDLSLPHEEGAPASRTSATGLGVIATLRATGGPHVVVLSVHGEADIVRAALAAGASGYVLKESVSYDLPAAVRAANVGALYLSAELSSLLSHPVDAEESGPRLSPREREVVGLIVDGRSTKDIATMLFTSPKTVEKQRRDAMRKLGVSNVAMLVRSYIDLYGAPGQERS